MKGTATVMSRCSMLSFGGADCQIYAEMRRIARRLTATAASAIGNLFCEYCILQSQEQGQRHTGSHETAAFSKTDL